MFRFPDPNKITPEEFELTVKRWFETFADSLDEFDATHREVAEGVDGDYEIDVTVRFTAFDGAAFHIICERKKHNSAIKRETIQILRDRKESLGAHKAFLVATAPFQSGAGTYAETHGIALIEIVNGAAAYIQNSAAPRTPQIPDNADPYVGMFYGDTSGGLIYPVLIDTRHTYEIECFLKSTP